MEEEYGGRRGNENVCRDESFAKKSCNLLYILRLFSYRDQKSIFLRAGSDSTVICGILLSI